MTSYSKESTRFILPAKTRITWWAFQLTGFVSRYVISMDEHIHWTDGLSAANGRTGDCMWRCSWIGCWLRSSDEPHGMDIWCGGFVKRNLKLWNPPRSQPIWLATPGRCLQSTYSYHFSTETYLWVNSKCRNFAEIVAPVLAQHYADAINNICNWRGVKPKIIKMQISLKSERKKYGKNVRSTTLLNRILMTKPMMYVMVSRTAMSIDRWQIERAAAA